MSGRKSSWRIAVIVVVIAAIGVGGFFLLRKPKKPKYKTATVTRGEILAQVSATGTVNPVKQVTVGSQVSGIVDTVMVDYNDQVKAGQVLARIDPRNYQAALVQAQANLTSAEVALAQARREFSHADTLLKAGLISQDQWFTAKTSLEQAQTRVVQAQGNYDQAATNLAFTTITAPMNGVVIARKVDNGQTVAASFSAPELFSIADLSRMQVEVAIQEADVGKLDTGMVASFKVDAYSGRTFEGKLVQIRNEPVTNQNVVTYVGIVHVDNPGELLKPGMTADVKIEVMHVPDVLIVPSAALNAKLGSLLGLKTEARPQGASGRIAPGEQQSPPGGTRSDTGRSSSRRRTGEPRLAAGGSVRRATVYLLEKGKPVPRAVEIGANDSYNTEVKSGLDEGEVVILGLETARVNPFQQTTRPPGGGFR